MEEGITKNKIELLTPKGNEEDIPDSYGCSLCSSNIEILLYDGTNISFQCLNKDTKNNHGIINIPINEYLEKMEKNTYLYFQCDTCGAKQNMNINDKIFNYCINCKKVICEKCLFKHSKDKKGHNIIKTNEINIKCLVHNSEIIGICLECNIDICKDCLKDMSHLYHKKNIIYEVQLSKEEIEYHNEFINKLKKDKEDLEKSEKNEIEYLNRKLVADQHEITEKYNERNIENNNELQKELNINENKLNQALEELKKNYENKIQSLKNEYNRNSKQIKEKYEEINRKNNIEKNKDLEYAEKNYKDRINEIKLKSNLNKIEDEIKINEILKKSLEKYPNNYYNNINILHILFYYYLINEKKEINRKFSNLYLNKEELYKKQKQICENKKIKEIIDLMEADYYISGFTEEEEVIDKIKEFNFNLEKIRHWIESLM